MKKRHKKVKKYEREAKNLKSLKTLKRPAKIAKRGANLAGKTAVRGPLNMSVPPRASRDSRRSRGMSKSPRGGRFWQAIL